MRKHIILLLVLCAILSLPPLYARQIRITLGVEDGWEDLSQAEGVRFIEGKRGFTDIVLLDGEYTPDSDTDLLLHFNNSAFDYAGGYSTIEGIGRISTRISRLGTGAGVFQGDGRGIVLAPHTGSMFSPGVMWGDFSIEFWLYPATLGQGDEILLWEGSRRHGDRIISQAVRCSISDRSLAWRFENIFLPADHSELVIELSGRVGLIPRTWRHHLLRFDSSVGLLEYLVDGVPAAVTHTTASGDEDGEFYVPLTGKAIEENLKIGPTLNGLLDEFRISRSFNTEPFIDTFPQTTGTAKSRVFDLGYSNSRLTKIDADIDTPGDTGILFYYRLGENFRGGGEVVGDWAPFHPGEVFPEATRGRYLQVLVELFPDGLGQDTPSVSTIDILYEPDLPPHPPGWVNVEAGNGTLILSWQASTDSDVAGYLVYYGSKPGQYFGTDSETGESPIDVGRSTGVTLGGLINGRLYYITVVSYDAGDPPHMSDFSRETAARPSNIHRK